MDTLHIEETQGNHPKIQVQILVTNVQVWDQDTQSVPEALRINKHNGNHLWRYSINNEMPKIDNAVDEYGGYPSNLIGYQNITGHMIFGVKMGNNFCRKARFVVDVHKTEMPRSITYSTVLS